MDKKDNVVIIIQARIGSSRLPGKILMDLEGEPALWHIVNRLKSCRLVQRIVIATTTEKKDDVVEELCRKRGIDLFRGSENDVLDRYYQAAKIYGADIVVRVTGDCPLIDPEVTDKVIAAYLAVKNEFDGASNAVKRTYPRGLDTEIVSFPALEKIWKTAKERYQREHVLCYMYERPDIFRILSVENDEDLSDLRWTVDEEPDLKLVREIYKRLYRKNKIFLTEDILKILKKEPDLAGINKMISQKDHRL